MEKIPSSKTPEKTSPKEKLISLLNKFPCTLKDVACNKKLLVAFFVASVAVGTIDLTLKTKDTQTPVDVLDDDKKRLIEEAVEDLNSSVDSLDKTVDSFRLSVQQLLQDFEAVKEIEYEAKIDALEKKRLNSLTPENLERERDLSEKHGFQQDVQLIEEILEQKNKIKQIDTL